MQLGSSQVHGRCVSSRTGANYLLQSARTFRKTRSRDAGQSHGHSTGTGHVLITLLCISLPLKLCNLVVFFLKPVVKAARIDSPVAPERSDRPIPEENSLTAFDVMVG